jgi:hypothetical protein
VKVVTLSPIVPESVVGSSTGADGAPGAIVSTLNEYGVTAFAGFGRTSLPVSWCAPSANRVVVVTQTLPKLSELNVPMATPSIFIAYDDRPPSPANTNVGVALELAFGSEPSCSRFPHEPSSSIA